MVLPFFFKTKLERFNVFMSEAIINSHCNRNGYGAENKASVSFSKRVFWLCYLYSQRIKQKELNKIWNNIFC